MRAAARVRAGAALLDERRPGWAAEIDRGALDLASCSDCILGQVYGGFWRGIGLALGLEYLGHEAASPDTPMGRDITAHGFDMGTERGTYAGLTRLWLRAITARRGRGDR